MSQLEIEVETPVGKKTVHLDPYKDILLGERDVQVYYHHVVSYEIYVHISKDAEIYYVHYRLFSNKRDAEYIRKIKKDTAVYMLSRLKEINEYRIRELIPYFESEKEKIQLFDRINDYDQVLTDKEILEQLNKVQSFHFFGQHIVCHRTFPHTPHVIGYYSTVRHGSLPIYCTGRSGILLLMNGKKVQLIISKACPEDCYGHYLFFEILEDA